MISNLKEIYGKETSEKGLFSKTEEMSQAQASDVVSQNLKEVLKKDAALPVNYDGLLSRSSLTDGVIEMSVPTKYQRKILYDSHCLILARHPSSSKNYDVHREMY